MSGGKRALRPEPRRPRTHTGRHRAVKPRYGRIVLAATAAVVVLVAVVGGAGLLPHGKAPALAAVSQRIGRAAVQAGPTGHQRQHDQAPDASNATPAPGTSARRATPRRGGDVPLPSGSGSGRRIVFSQSQQRVWLVRHNGTVRTTYLVSGSVENNLHPGTFQVYSRSRHAIGVDDSGTMQYFVRFTRGPTGAAIGFHSIPVKDGKPLQTRAQLGTPESHGCVRQAKPDAIVLWKFAPLGTKVVVTA
ncbi:MAG: L,D-transpeptidase [Nocardioidaceae bacterium]|nr:L,D-transpeptidase [Nocardioidaceae bacterium]MCL2614756.1 L,D-transpeptidase [Nocardioidaceae bacterium]